jgi:hypothetical protein
MTAVVTEKKVEKELREGATRKNGLEKWKRERPEPVITGLGPLF